MFKHIGEVHYPQVEVTGHNAGYNPNNGQPEQIRVQGSLEQEKLAREAARWRHACQGEHEVGQRQGQQRTAFGQAFVIVQHHPLPIFLFNSNHDCEGAQVGEEIGQHVEKGGAYSGITANSGGNAHQNIPGVSDAGIGQHTLDIGLGQRYKIADDHR